MDYILWDLQIDQKISFVMICHPVKSKIKKKVSVLYPRHTYTPDEEVTLYLTLQDASTIYGTFKTFQVLSDL